MTVATRNDLAAAVADHRADPQAHPELLQLSQAITSAGIRFNPADGTQLHTAIEQTVDVAVDAAIVRHMADPNAHGELKQVRQVVTATGMAFDGSNAVQLHSAVAQMINTHLVAGIAVHKADPFAHSEQKQVRTVITDAGMVYDPADGTQLSVAIRKAIAASPPQDAAETAAAVTGPNQRLADDGYQRFPGGLILQWGQFAEGALPLVPGETVVRSIPFPIPFPGRCLKVIASSTQDHVLAVPTNISATGFTPSFSTGLASSLPLGLHYLAIGF